MTMSEVYPTPGKIRIYPAATTQTAQKTSTSRLQPTKKQANHTVADFFSSLLDIQPHPAQAQCVDDNRDRT